MNALKPYGPRADDTAMSNGFPQHTSAPPAGWYPDGATPGVVRWFDGAAWTEHVQTVVPQPYGPAQAFPGTVVPTTDDGPTNALHWVVPVGRSWQSIVAGYAGLFALFIPPVALLSIPLGLVALRQARMGGHGRGRAWFAIVAGVVGLVWGTALLVG